MLNARTASRLATFWNSLVKLPLSCRRGTEICPGTDRLKKPGVSLGHLKLVCQMTGGTKCSATG